MSRLIPALRTAFAEYGVDICEPFNVGRYKQLVKFPITDFGRENALGVVIGSTNVFWPKFVQFIRSVPELPANPVDSFYQQAVDTVLAMEPFDKMVHETRFDWNSPRTGKFVHIQTAGHLAGFAHYDQDSFWSCHPVFGLWFVYRAVIIFDVDFDGPEPFPAPHVLTKDMINEIQKWTEVANTERWQRFETRLALRDSCPIGRDTHRYSGDLLNYFFPIENSREEIIERIRAGAGQSCEQQAQHDDCCKSSS